MRFVKGLMGDKELQVITDVSGIKTCVPAVCVLYLAVFLRALCRALIILWSPGGVLFP